VSRSLIIADYQMTEVVGFSVTHDLVVNGFAGRISNPSQYRLRWYSGGSVDLYADPNSPGWDANGGTLNPSTQGGLFDMSLNVLDSTSSALRNQVDRVIFNVSGLCFQAADPTVPGYNGGVRPNLGLTSHDTTGYGPGGYTNATADWIAYINAAVTNVKSRYPNVKMILLQPNLRGHNGISLATQSSNSGNPGYDNGGFSAGFGVVRAHYTAPYVNLAIDSVVRANVRPGWLGENTDNTQVLDWAGHLSTTEYTTLGQAMADYYNANL
jgi:hypothetical protein